MKNYTEIFIKLVDTVIDENKKYFSQLKNIEDIDELKRKILVDYNIDYANKSHYNQLFENKIQEFINEEQKDKKLESNFLRKVSKQIEIEYLLKKLSKEKAKFYYSISNMLIFYGLYKKELIMPISNHIFWKKLIKKLYLFTLMDNNQFNNCCDDSYYNHPDFNKLQKLVEAKQVIEEKLKETIEIIDTEVVFKKGQEDRIVQKIEKKLSQLDLFNFLRFMFNLYENDKTNHDTMMTPFKYIINILIKNIYSSKHKINDKKKVRNALSLLTSFISLYQLKEDKFESMYINEHNIAKHLRKQVLYTNFYPLYSLKTNTLIEYINYIIKPSIDEKVFYNEFGFSIQDLIKFFELLDKQQDNIVTFEKNNIFNYEQKILELFSIDSKVVNQNYSSISSLSKNKNLFVMSPIIKYKNTFYIIGFKYFKMNFYNTLVEKIRTKIDKNINGKIGNNVDAFVKNIFTSIKDKSNYEIFSGNYAPPKKENPESDLCLKADTDIIFIENKNKYLTKHSFFGSDSNIIKDLVLSFIFSQKQLFKHERNLKKFKNLKFKDGNELIYNNHKIIKISVSTNNWFNIMNNIPQNVLYALMRLRFNIEDDKQYEDKDGFIKANKYLDELQKVISEMDGNEIFNMRIVLNQTLFLPLELIVDKSRDENFIECLKSIVSMKMNTDNILSIYDFCQYLENHKKRLND